MYLFNEPLQEGLILKRSSRFTMYVLLDGKLIKCHCPTTGRIGDIDTKNIACLISVSKDKKRKLPYTVEAISCDEIDKNEKNWIGINQILSNKLVEHFLRQHELDKMISEFSDISREVKLGTSKLDFFAGFTYIEVKTPLTTLHVKYGKHIKVKAITPFSSTERFTKHINELAGSLENHKRGILLTVYQYEVTQKKKHQKSTHYEEVRYAMNVAKNKGIETWDIQFRFTPKGVTLCMYENTTTKNPVNG
ncbi:DNA/RNA nuclease SfsA [Amedibacillus sp. YH-ame6]